MQFKNSLVKIITTFFYIGYLPFVPGTFGSAVGLLVYFLIKDNLLTYILFTSVLIALGFLTSGRAEAIFGQKDPKRIVIDEVCGMLLSLMFIPYDIRLVIIAFILFRILDALKAYPAGKFQDLHGSAGIMSDDLVAGVYTNIILQVVLRFI